MPARLRVVDASAWIEWIIDSPLGIQLAGWLPAKAQCIVPTIVQLELSKWLLRERGEEQADRIIAYTQTCIVVPLDTTAQHHQAELVTCDAHFAGLPDVRCLPKAGQ